MKKGRSLLFVLTSVIMLGGLILSACTPAATATNPPQATAAQATAVPATEVPASTIKGTIRVGSWDSGPALEPFNAAIKSFESANPDAKVQLESVPQEYGTKLLTQFAAGTAPDVFQVGDGDVSNFAAQGVLEPLDPFINGDNPLDMSVFFPGVAAIGKVGDKTYLLTKDYSPLVLYYNKALFDAAGVAYPTADWTWDDLLAAAQKLTDPAKTQWGLQIPNSWGDPLWTRGIQPLIHQNGGSIIAPDGSKATGYLNSPATVAALQWYVDLFLTHKVSPTKADVESLAGTDLFQNGNVAMLWTGRWPLKDFVANTDLSFGTVGLPAGEQRANSICWAGFAIYSKSPNKDTAWAFLKHIAAGDGAEEFANYALTAVQPIAESQGLEADPYDAPIVKDLENIKPLPEFTNPKYNDCVDKFFKENLEKVFLQGLGVQEAMDTAAQQADACLATAASN
jgi:multiple sugar transport system substrate-binding protein